MLNCENLHNADSPSRSYTCYQVDPTLDRVAIDHNIQYESIRNTGYMFYASSFWRTIPWFLIEDDNWRTQFKQKRNMVENTKQLSDSAKTWKLGKQEIFIWNTLGTGLNLQLKKERFATIRKVYIWKDQNLVWILYDKI